MRSRSLGPGEKSKESSMSKIAVLKVVIETEQHVVDARQRTRQIAAALGFENQDQVRLATAVSELARNAYQYAGGGRLEFAFESSVRPQNFTITVSDLGPGIADLPSVLSGDYVSKTGMGVGLTGAKKLTDSFEIESTASGTKITIGKTLTRAKPISTFDLNALAETLHRERPTTAFQEIQRQNVELLEALESLRARQDELSLLNQELNETNRGVVALYAELDERASLLQKANEVKTNFLSNMTHEFRTPLTSIISLARLLIDRVDGELTPEQERQVGYIRKSSEGLLELVSDLLDLAKVEAGRIALKIADVRVDDVLGTLRGVFRPILANESDVELIVNGAPELPILVSDEGKIAQILRNLVSNALKFTERGQVTVEAVMLNTDDVLFRVTDTGIGISLKNQERIFEDFSQIESELQKRLRGTGLGLPLSRRLARLLGGDLWVESEVGKGSTFLVRLPRVYTGEAIGQLLESNAATPDAPRTPSVTDASVMIVDDDESSRYVLKNLIRSFLDIQVIECDSPKSALELLARVQPRLIFLDLSMPNMTGFELLRSLKSNENSADIPVCINTAKILTPDESDFLQQLCIGILSKERSNLVRANKELRSCLEVVGLLSPLQTEIDQ